MRLRSHSQWAIFDFFTRACAGRVDGESPAIAYSWPAAQFWPQRQASIADPRRGCETFAVRHLEAVPMIYEFRTYTLHPRSLPSSSSAGCP